MTVLQPRTLLAKYLAPRVLPDLLMTFRTGLPISDVGRYGLNPAWQNLCRIGIWPLRPGVFVH